MNKQILLLIFLIISGITYARITNSDSLRLDNLELKIEQMDNQLKEVRRDELNYQIEKDLLKETYSNNYEKISLMITIVLGIIGVLGYLGIKDINSIKKEYTTELANLKQLQTEIASKFTEFQTSKEKYDTELRDILKTNEEQNKKIKVLELKDKINNLFKDELYGSALEFCIVGLELSPNDIILLHQKAMIHTRLRNYKDSINSYLRILEIDKDNHSAVFNVAEVYLMNNQKSEFDEILAKNSTLFKEKINGKLLEIFSIISNYQDKNMNQLMTISLANIDLTDMTTKRKRIRGWVLKDLLIYISGEPNSNEKVVVQNLLWYLDGQLTATEFSTRTKIELPAPPKV
jgi:tetratricopeptide (TPR) repeat protein